jgi:hypothetical protein
MRLQVRHISTSTTVCSSLIALAIPAIVPAQTYISAEDEAFYEAYTDGWQTGDWSGRGFKGWQLFAPDYGATSEEQYAGFFIAEKDQEDDLIATAREGRAFGIFANGTGFEETAAFRAFERPLSVGDVFSLRFEFDGFGTKFERDAGGISSVGIALLHSETANDLSELSEGRALTVAIIKGLSTYQILDASGRFNTRVFLDQTGVEVGVTAGEAGQYDLQITTLSNQVLHSFPNRQMNLPSSEDEESPMDASLKSFALFNLNGGANNAYFGAFQISRQEGKF